MCEQNTALYGPNIASYPVRIVRESMTDQNIVFDDVASGIAYPDTIKLLLVDYDNQTMNLVNSNQIKISAITSGARLLGIDSASLVNGEAEFDNLQFVYTPGQANIQYIATCNQIDSNKVSYLDLLTNDTINVSFRYCQPGEIMIDGSTCSPCGAGTYSFEWNSTQCTDCMDRAT